jgi:hypothetical protein
MCSGLGLARPFVLGAAPGSYGARACAVAVPGSRLSHSRAQASMANAKNRSESRSYRTRSRRHPASQATAHGASSLRTNTFEPVFRQLHRVKRHHAPTNA